MFFHLLIGAGVLIIFFVGVFLIELGVVGITLGTDGTLGVLRVGVLVFVGVVLMPPPQPPPANQPPPPANHPLLTGCTGTTGMIGAAMVMV